MENNVCYKYFLYLGVHPSHSLKKCLCWFNISTIICILFLGLLKFYRDKDLETLESFICISFACIKYITLAIMSKTIKHIVKTTEHFWKLNVEDNQVTTSLDHLKLVENIYKSVFVVVILVFGAKPFIIKGSTVFNCYISYIPDSLYYGLEYYVLIIGASIFVSTNIFLCSLTISAVIQFRLLNIKIKELNLEDVEENYDVEIFTRELKFIIQHQQLLMRHVQDLNKLFSTPTALLMVGVVSLMCLNMYAISTSEGSALNFGRILVSTTAVTAEFFMVYGLPAQLLMDEAAATANIIYCECKWYIPKLRPLQKHFLYMIFRSQKDVCIRVANYHILNHRTILIMIRTAYSFYTFLQKIT